MNTDYPSDCSPLDLAISKRCWFCQDYRDVKLNMSVKHYVQRNHYFLDANATVFHCVNFCHNPIAETAECVRYEILCNVL